MLFSSLALFAAAGSGLPNQALKPPAKPSAVQFNRDIQPILSDKCFACHGPDKNKRQANLRLDQRDSALQRGAIVPGSPEKSALVKRIEAADPAFRMPPLSFHKALTSTQRALLVRWVKEGAVYEAHWSYIPPKRPPVPAIQNAKSKIQNPIDAFILAKLRDKRLTPSPEADRRTLIRRLYLDLVGFPPSPNEVSDFLADRSPNAYEKVVDRLLASPHYGERMAAPWLDVVRYADTVGFHGDQNMNAWAYRDYVINSFNDNKPFDRFTIEQIAGDLLPNPTPEALTATCFNRLNMVTREGGAQPKEYLAKYAADRVRTVSMAWLGSTMGCCECHDHKYDPFTQKDFYSLAAFFADMKQWGVYADYSYTPNPDLRGVGNDHPFPPEIHVESPYLKQRIVRDREAIRKLSAETAPTLEKNPAAKAAFDEWMNGARTFLTKHPDGWHTPADTQLVGGDGKPAEPAAARQNDGSLVVSKDAPADIILNATPTSGWLSAVRLEFLPTAAYKGSILRQGNPGLLRVGLTLRHANGKTQSLAVRHASANHYEPRFANSFEIIGVQGGWQLSKSHLKEPNTSLWLLDSPVKLEAGDKVELSLRGPRVGCVRVAASPFGPDDPSSQNLTADLKTVLSTDPANKAAALETYLRGTGWSTEQFARLKQLEADILECRSGITPVMVTEAAAKPMTMRVLPRGNWQDESGPIVEPAVPHFLPASSLPTGRRLTRLDLANWLISPENPLTARMFVNRLWKQFFGNGLSDKVEDLGTQGEWPSHPELLDWLAVEFMKPEHRTRNTEHLHPWDIKHIVRLIVTSATYRQSSKLPPDALAIDPGNRLLASQNPRRLEAEFVRDNALSIAGMLNMDLGGPPCKPYQPAGYYGNLQFPDREYQPDKDDRQWRRGIYMHWQRTFLHPMLANFDAPSREDCTAFRTVANTPQQALTLLNDPEFVEAARAFAARLLAEPGTDADRLERAYEIALARPIKPREKESLLAFLQKVRAEERNPQNDPKKLISVGYSPAAKGDPVEEAAWTTVCRVILNLHETITRY